MKEFTKLEVIGSIILGLIIAALILVVWFGIGLFVYSLWR